jgi:hypothetical protein
MNLYVYLYVCSSIVYVYARKIIKLLLYIHISYVPSIEFTQKFM